MNISRTKQESVSLEAVQRTALSCVSRCANAIKVWTSPEGDDRMSELDTGQVRIHEVAHQRRKTFRHLEAKL